MDALQLQHGQLDRRPVVLELLDVVLQPLLVLLRELRVAAAGRGAGRAEKTDKEKPSHFQVTATRSFLLALLHTPSLQQFLGGSPGGKRHSSWHSKLIPPFRK